MSKLNFRSMLCSLRRLCHTMTLMRLYRRKKIKRTLKMKVSIIIRIMNRILSHKLINTAIINLLVLSMFHRIPKKFTIKILFLTTSLHQLTRLLIFNSSITLIRIQDNNNNKTIFLIEVCMKLSN